MSVRNGIDPAAGLLRRASLAALIWLGLATGRLAAAAPAVPAGNPFLIRSWQVEQRLPNDTINAITETRDGYLWLGTEEGLARFDGIRCRVFKLPDGLASLQISALLEDRQGVLWIGTVGGGLSRYAGDKLETFSSRDGLAGDSITALAEGTDGCLWVGTPRGLSCRRDGRFVPVAKGLRSLYVYDLTRDQSGGILAATLHNGLVRIADTGVTDLGRPAGEGNLNPRCVLVDNAARVWVGSRDKFVACRENGRWTRFGTNDGLPFVEMDKLAQTPDGTIWAGTLDNGLYYLRNGRFQALRRQDGLADDSILSLHAGTTRFLWAGTLSGGLCRIGPKKLSVFHLADQNATECQLLSLAETPDDGICAGTYGHGLYRWRGNGEFQPVAKSRNHLFVSALLGGSDGSLWWGAGPVLYQSKGDRLLAGYEDVWWLHGDRVWCLCEDHTAGGGLWVGTYNGKCGLLRRSKFTPVPGLSSKPVTALAQTRDGTVWIGSLGGGLARFQDGKVTEFTTREGLRSNLIRTLAIDGGGTLWIGTDGGGLARRVHDRFDNFTAEQGLPDDTVLQILPDDDGNLWLGCNQGIARIGIRVLEDVAAGRADSLHALVLDGTDGLASEQCVDNFGAALKSRAGQLCFLTHKGMAVIDPRQQTDTIKPPGVLLEEVLVDGRVRPGQTAPGAGRTGMEIPPGRHDLEFRYTGFNFDAPERIRFKYELAGLDQTWVEARGERVARYANVPPGRYRFMVTACNSDGLWNETMAETALVVRPHFWQTPWFEAAAAVTLLGLIGTATRYVERRRYRTRLARLEQERAMEYERIRIARDLHDELGSDLTHISMLSNRAQAPGASDTDRLDKLETRMKKISARLAHTVRSLDEIVWAVNPRNDSLRSLLLYFTQFARELFEGTGINCRFQIPENLPRVPLPPEVRHNIFLAVKEVLTNVLKHSRATEIVLRTSTAGPQLQIEIQDNGIGFDPATVPPDGEHNGLENLRQRMKGLGGDLILEAGPGRGTLVRLKVHCPAGVREAK